jgi:hypothetical protein
VPDFQIVFQNIADLIQEDEQKRIVAIQNSVELYLCNHAQFFPQFEGENGKDYAKRLADDAYAINFLRRIVDTFTAYLYGMPVARQCTDERADKLMQRLWKRQNMQLYMQKRKKDGGICGTAYTVARFRPDLFEKDETIPIIYEPVDPAFVTVRFDPAYPTRIRAAIIHYLFDESSGVSQVDRYKGDTRTPHDYVEYITDDEWLVWIDGKLQDGKNGERDIMNWELYEGANPVGSVNAVFTVYRNYEIDWVPYGLSDIKDAIPLNLKLDQRKSDEGAIISYHGLPLFVVDFDMTNVRRGSRRTLEIPAGGQAEYKTWDNNIEASLKHCTQLVRDELAVSRLPEAALFSEGMRNLRSAPALELAFSPAREAVNEQRTTYGDAEARRTAGDLLILERMHGLREIEDKSMEILWPKKFLPVDTFIEIETLRQRRELGLDSWDDQLKLEHPDWDDDDIAKHKAKCEKDPLFKSNSSGGFFSPGEKSAQQEPPERASGEARE